MTKCDGEVNSITMIKLDNVLPCRYIVTMMTSSEQLPIKWATRSQNEEVPSEDVIKMAKYLKRSKFWSEDDGCYRIQDK